MGTVALLPQDCLSSTQSQEKRPYNNMIYWHEGPQRTRRTYIKHIPSRKPNSDGMDPKSRKEADDRAGNVSTKFPVVTILQRPKDKETREMIIAQLVMDLKANTSTTMPEKQSEVFSKSRKENHDSEKPKQLKVAQSMKAKPLKDPKPQRDQRSNGAKTAGSGKVGLIEKKPDNAVNVKQPRVDSKKAVINTDDALAPNTKVKSDGQRKDPTKVKSDGQRKDARDVSLTSLRRASTDPQTVVHLANQFRLKLISEESKPKLPDLNEVVTRSMSGHENWAGSAYSISPAPSSLPLPRFSSTLKTVDSSVIPEHQHTRHVYMQPTIVTSPPTQSKVAGTYDVVLATKSLRKILNLDP